MIIRGGFNVYPREIEEVMMTHPAVSLAAVIGVPDERLGKRSRPFVVRKTGAAVTEAELIEWCREQLAAFKYPRIDRVPGCAADRPDRQDSQARAEDQQTLKRLAMLRRWHSSLAFPSLGRGGAAMAKCRDVMTQDPVSCEPGDAIAQVARHDETADVGSVPVVDSQDSKRLVGIVTDRDIVVKVVAAGRRSDQATVSDAMTPNPASCREDDDVDQALKLMAERQVRRMPIVDAQRRLSGIIAQADVATRVNRDERDRRARRSDLRVRRT